MAVSQNAKAAQRAYYAKQNKPDNKYLPFTGIITYSDIRSIGLKIPGQSNGTKPYTFPIGHVLIQPVGTELNAGGPDTSVITGCSEQFRDQIRQSIEVIAWIPVWLLDSRNIDKSRSLFKTSGVDDNAP